MSFVIAAPAVVESAATNLASIGSNISAANAAAINSVLVENPVILLLPANGRKNRFGNIGPWS